mgnify:CR=1 FL=1
MKRNTLFIIFVISIFSLLYLTACGTPPAEELGNTQEQTQSAEKNASSNENKTGSEDTTDANEETPTSPDEQPEISPEEGCQVGSKRPCYTGPQGTKGVGICKAGEQACQQDGTWGTCQGEVLPASNELCDKKDNNCNGQTDENCSNPQCRPGSRKSCHTHAKGECAQGNQLCDPSGKWTPCIPLKKPVKEICHDRRDNDCDGQTDEGCEAGVGCRPGTKKPCGSDTGECKKGVQVCNSKGTYGPCTGEVKPVKEICHDRKDNDCDGQTDEGCAVGTGCRPGTKASCGSDTGACKKGVQTCNSKGAYGPCIGGIKPTKEVCNDKKDNDCDGQIDEGCTTGCKPGLRRPCGKTDVGACRRGTQVCNNQQTWGPCVGEITPKTEVCDGVDNDCDGQLNEGLKVECYGGPTGTAGKGICKKGYRICTRLSRNRYGWSNCLGMVLPKKTEDCNGKDDDCDGSVDEQLIKNCYSGPAGSSGECRAGKISCTGGKWTKCIGEVLPKAETCDNKDNDCDGKVDESLKRTCYTGPAGTNGKGLCRSGSSYCSRGKWGGCVGEVKPATETCDGKDNDCDGLVDEGLQKKDWYLDADKDSYGDPSKKVSNCRAPAGYVANNKDCYDKNKNARPGQTAYFNKHRGDGSFDYDCDGKSTQRWPGYLQCKTLPGYKCQVTQYGFRAPTACGKVAQSGGSCVWRRNTRRCHPYFNGSNIYQTCR